MCLGRIVSLCDVSVVMIIAKWWCIMMAAALKNGLDD